MPRLLGLAQVQEPRHGRRATRDDQVRLGEEITFHYPGEDGVSLGTGGELVVAVQHQQAMVPMVTLNPLEDGRLGFWIGVREEVVEFTGRLHAAVPEPQEGQQWVVGEELSILPVDAQLPGKAGLADAGCPFHYNHP